MKLQEIFSKLKKSVEWKNASKEHKNLFFCAAFLILNFKQNQFEYSLDYRNDKKLLAFKMPADEKSSIILTTDDLLESPKPLEQINESELPKIKIDIEEIKPTVQGAIADNKIQSTLEEAIAVLQDFNGKIIWNLTCICAGFVILNVHIDPFTGKILKFEKKNLLDFASLKKVDKK
jgi:hypothetical protein